MVMEVEDEVQVIGPPMQIHTPILQLTYQTPPSETTSTMVRPQQTTIVNTKYYANASGDSSKMQ